MRGVFGTELVRSVELLCGHLAAAVENLLIQSSLERQVRELTTSGEQVTTTMERMRMLLRNIQTEHAAMDLAATLHSSAVFLHHELQRQGVDLSTTGLERVVPFRGDGAQLQIAGVNLIRNALQAMEGQPAGRQPAALPGSAGRGRARLDPGRRQRPRLSGWLPR